MNDSKLPMHAFNLAQMVNEGPQMVGGVRADAMLAETDPVPLPSTEDEVLGDGELVPVKVDTLDPGLVVDETHNHLMDSNSNDVARPDVVIHEMRSDEEEWERHISRTPAQYLQGNLNCLSKILSGADFPELNDAMRMIDALQSWITFLAHAEAATKGAAT